MFIKLVDGGKAPEKKTEGAAALDCYARTDSDVVIMPFETVTVPLGFAVDVGKAHYGEIRPRSGLSSRGISVALGTIDNDYRGEVKATVTNLSEDDYVIRNGDRICQFMCCVLSANQYDIVEELDETARGSGGFGSTGI